MASADDFRQLADELRQIGASLVQAAGDPELTLLIVHALNTAAMRPAWWAREVEHEVADKLVQEAIARARAGL